GLERAIQGFSAERGHRRAVLLLGDGMSLHHPLTADDRARLADEMVAKEVSFFAIPVGPRLDAHNLHGLAGGTGGSIVRIQPRETVKELIERWKQAVQAPVFYPASLSFTTGAVADVLPTKLPPLRGDTPTLVVGRLGETGQLAYRIEGRVNG